MKIDRHTLRRRNSAVKHAATIKSALLRWALVASFGIAGVPVAMAQQESAPESAGNSSQTPPAQSQPQAVTLLNQVIKRITMGPAFAAKVRQRVWTAGREVIGVGIYEQAGGGTGRFNLHLSMHDGDGKHTLQQISDGRLTWTRTVIAEEVSLKRVDVGRLDEWVRSADGPKGDLPPRLKIGAWAEMLDTIQRDYILTIGSSQLQSRPVLVISGTLREDARQRVLQQAQRDRWPALYPSQVKIAVATSDDEVTNIGKGLPVRLEYWSDPVVGSSVTADAANQAGRLVTLIEMYAIHRIKPPPMNRFLLDTQDAINFVNETDRYLQQYGIHLTASQRRQLLR
jgi:hypothetical protein